MRKLIIFLLFVNIIIISCSKKSNLSVDNENNIEIEEKNNTELDKISIWALSGNYENGNGTIIDINNDSNNIWILRKHIQRREFPVWLDSFKELYVYNEPLIKNANLITTICGEPFYIKHVLEAYMQDKIHYWIKIITDNDLIG